MKILMATIFLMGVCSSVYAATSSSSAQALCGASQTLASGVYIACYKDEQLTCNEDGECWCELTAACQQACTVSKTCGLKSEAPEKE